MGLQTSQIRHIYMLQNNGWEDLVWVSHGPRGFVLTSDQPRLDPAVYKPTACYSQSPWNTTHRKIMLIICHCYPVLESWQLLQDAEQWVERTLSRFLACNTSFTILRTAVLKNRTAPYGSYLYHLDINREQYYSRNQGRYTHTHTQNVECDWSKICSNA